MATPDGSKQSLLKKAFVDPFRLGKSRRKSSVPIFPVVPDPGESSEPSEPLEPVELSVPLDPLDALPGLEYDFLDPNEKSIRLLQIIPAPEYEPIQASMSVCDLDEKPAYIALSYTWDKQGRPTKHIDIDGAKFVVGEGLWNFLKQYRKKDFLRRCSEKNPPKAMPLWIDAIAINQSNTLERNHQVSLMRDIYSGAESVVVWLGLATGSEELAYMLGRRPSLLKIPDFHLALAEVLNKPYWSRIWVVQEFVLAQKVDIWCGDLTIDVTVVETIWRNGLSSTPVASATKEIYESRGYLLFKYRRDFKHSKKYRRDVVGRRNSRSLKSTFRLRDLLQAFASSQSTVAYDRVYGFLGIASKGRGEKILPDYNKSLVELLVDVLRNQCHSDVKGGDKDDYKFLTFLMDALKVSGEELTRHVLKLCPEVQPHVYVLTATPCVTASISFVSTITEVGEFVDYDEAFLHKTWTASGWTRSSMHPKSFSSQDILDLGEIVKKRETEILLSFADPHTPTGNPGPSEKVRQSMIEQSTDLIITGLVKASIERDSNASGTMEASSGGNRVVRDIIKRSMSKDATAMYAAARNKLCRRDTDQRHAHYTSFMGANNITGFACGGGPGSYEVRPGDRVCMFSGITDSNNAFILRLSPSGRWLISGFAIILLPELRTPSVRRADTAATLVNTMGLLSRQQTLVNDTTMCFHCHLSDLIELQRCQLLSEVQMHRLLEETLRRDAEGRNKHCCQQGGGEHEILEFGL